MNSSEVPPRSGTNPPSDKEERAAELLHATLAVALNAVFSRVKLEVERADAESLKKRLYRDQYGRWSLRSEVAGGRVIEYADALEEAEIAADQISSEIRKKILSLVDKYNEKLVAIADGIIAVAGEAAKPADEITVQAEARSDEEAAPAGAGDPDPSTPIGDGPESEIGRDAPAPDPSVERGSDASPNLVMFEDAIRRLRTSNLKSIAAHDDAKKLKEEVAALERMLGARADRSRGQAGVKEGAFYRYVLGRSGISPDAVADEERPELERLASGLRDDIASGLAVQDYLIRSGVIASEREWLDRIRSADSETIEALGTVAESDAKSIRVFITGTNRDGAEGGPTAFADAFAVPEGERDRLAELFRLRVQSREDQMNAHLRKEWNKRKHALDRSSAESVEASIEGRLKVQCDAYEMRIDTAQDIGTLLGIGERIPVGKEKTKLKRVFLRRVSADDKDLAGLDPAARKAVADRMNERVVSLNNALRIHWEKRRADLLRADIGEPSADTGEGTVPPPRPEVGDEPTEAVPADAEPTLPSQPDQSDVIDLNPGDYEFIDENIAGQDITGEKEKVVPALPSPESSTIIERPRGADREIADGIAKTAYETERRREQAERIEALRSREAEIRTRLGTIDTELAAIGPEAGKLESDIREARAESEKARKKLRTFWGIFYRDDWADQIDEAAKKLTTELEAKRKRMEELESERTQLREELESVVSQLRDLEGVRIGEEQRAIYRHYGLEDAAVRSADDLTPEQHMQLQLRIEKLRKNYPEIAAYDLSEVFEELASDIRSGSGAERRQELRTRIDGLRTRYASARVTGEGQEKAAAQYHLALLALRDIEVSDLPSAGKESLKARIAEAHAFFLEEGISLERAETTARSEILPKNRFDSFVRDLGAKWNSIPRAVKYGLSAALIAGSFVVPPAALAARAIKSVMAGAGAYVGVEAGLDQLAEEHGKKTRRKRSDRSAGEIATYSGEHMANALSASLDSILRKTESEAKEQRKYRKMRRIAAVSTGVALAAIPGIGLIGGDEAAQAMPRIVPMSAGDAAVPAAFEPDAELPIPDEPAVPEAPIAGEVTEAPAVMPEEIEPEATAPVDIDADRIIGHPITVAAGTMPSDAIQEQLQLSGMGAEDAKEAARQMLIEYGERTDTPIHEYIGRALEGKTIVFEAGPDGPQIASIGRELLGQGGLASGAEATFHTDIDTPVPYEAPAVPAETAAAEVADATAAPSAGVDWSDGAQLAGEQPFGNEGPTLGMGPGEYPLQEGGVMSSDAAASADTPTSVTQGEMLAEQDAFADGTPSEMTAPGAETGTDASMTPAETSEAIRVEQVIESASPDVRESLLDAGPEATVRFAEYYQAGEAEILGSAEMHPGGVHDMKSLGDDVTAVQLMKDAVAFVDGGSELDARNLPTLLAEGHPDTDQMVRLADFVARAYETFGREGFPDVAGNETMQHYYERIQAMCAVSGADRIETDPEHFRRIVSEATSLRARAGAIAV